MVLLIIFTLLVEVQPQRLSAQVWLTATPASVQKDTNTAQLRYDRPTDAQGADQSHYNSVLNQRLSAQVWLTATPASVQKDTNTAQLRYDRPTDAQGADQSHYNSVLNQSSDDVLTEVNYSSCQVETTSLLTSSVCSKKHG
ncbi:hypothetical protein DPX16_12415 [Anabarilius grahami]|uniref:Uncharacterized protein n=1 Tax=Anabarilius grahami TaxID=495550 RepID=A0A3N0XFZ0_ANAGA|nr:hypothetical protein DPX16_12415 [Anabarilius grahami]